MRTSNPLMVLAVVGLLLRSVGCDMPPEEYFPPDASFGDTDNDSETEAGPEECPWNSGYPCTCNEIGAECGDQSKCLWVADEQEIEDGATSDVGFCSAACFEENTPCVKTGFAGESKCVLAGGGASFRCALLCEQDGDCPPDQYCKDVGWNELCHP